MTDIQDPPEIPDEGDDDEPEFGDGGEDDE